jgi:tetratricopeptide (TPR) repeat protein
VRATTLDPGYATAHLYRGIALLHRRRLDESLRELTAARTLDPLSAAVRLQLGRAYLFAGKPSEAVEALRAALELNPDFAAARQHLGEAYLQQGKSADALVEFRRAAQSGGARDSAQLAYALAMAGQRSEAMKVVGALAGAVTRRYLPPVPMAMAYAGLGDNTAAFRWLERAYSDRAPLMNALGVMPAFEPLHTDLRWKRLERLMRF